MENRESRIKQIDTHTKTLIPKKKKTNGKWKTLDLDGKKASGEEKATKRKKRQNNGVYSGSW